MATSASGWQVKEKSWEVMQIKSFTRWVNSFLVERQVAVEDIANDLEDGVNLCYLVSELTKNEIPKIHKAPKLPYLKIENLNKALAVINKFAADQGLKLHYSAESIMAHDLKTILGMCWVLIHKYSIEEISEDSSTAKDGLLLWCKKKTAGYNHVNVTNFTDSWSSGLAFCALIHKHQPSMIDYDSLSPENPEQNLTKAFDAAEQLGIPRLLDVEDMLNAKPDEKSVMTYVSYFWKRFASMNKTQNASSCLSSLLGKLLSTEEQLQKYLATASEFVQWVDAQFTSVFPQDFEELRAYRVGPKATNESTLFDLVNSYTLYGSNPVFVVPADLVPEQLQAKWDAKVEREVAFESQLKQQSADARLRQQRENKFRTGEQSIEQWLQTANENLVVDRDTLASVSAAKRRVNALSEQAQTMQERAAGLRGILSAEERPSQSIDQDLPAAQEKIASTLADLTQREKELSDRDTRFAELATELQNYSMWVEDSLASAREPIAANTIAEVQELEAGVDGIEFRAVPDDSGFEQNPYTSLTSSGLSQKLSEMQQEVEQRRARIAETRDAIQQTQQLCDSFLASARSFLQELETVEDQKTLATEYKDRLDKLSEQNHDLLSRGYTGELKPSLQACTAAHKERVRKLEAARAAAEQERLAGKVSQEVLQELQDAFRFFDRDNSGTLNQEELAAVFQSLGEDDTSEEVWKRFNLNSDQDISFDQFTEVMQDKYARRNQSTSRENVRASFKTIAGDNAEDGLITKEALDAALPANDVQSLVPKLKEVEGRPGVFSYVEFVETYCTQ